MKAVTETRSHDAWQGARERLVGMVADHAAPRDPRVLEAFRQVPRHLFIPDAQRVFAYDDRALPIGDEQTISQPSMIAIMLDALECQPSSRVLEVGAGSGYAAALLAHLAREVYAIEIRAALAERARMTLAQIGLTNVQIYVGDGSHGLTDHAPYDRILVSAAPAEIPHTLAEQLAPGGRIAIPVGDERGQTLLIGERRADGHIDWRRDVPCMFVPLIEL
jgi:protein-L-isoaspartate(D-aspartate) O-methyltransferase